MEDDGRPDLGADRMPTESEVQQKISALEKRLLTVGEAVRELATTVARLAAQRPHAVAVANLVTDRLERDNADDLDEWVRWLVGRYELDDIPECWAQHGAFVEELDALRVGWLATIGEEPAGLGPMQWHDLAGRAIERMKTIYRTCTDGTHRAWQAPDWATAEEGG